MQAQYPVNEKIIAQMFDRIAPRYDLMNSLLSARQDQRWRRQLLRSIPEREDGVLLDVATGTGEVLLQATRVRREYKKFWGVDIAPNMLQLARQKLMLPTYTSAADKVEFGEMSAEKLDFPARSVDCVSIAFGLRNVVDRAAALNEFYRVLKVDGRLLILEFFQPRRGLMSTLFQLYFHRVLPMIGGLLSDKAAYTYLPQSVAGFYTIRQLCDQLQQAGFRDIRYDKFLFGSCYLIQARKP